MRNISVKQIIEKIPSAIFRGDENCTINEVASIADLDAQPKPNSLAWVNDKKCASLAEKNFSLGVLICSAQAYEKLKSKKTSFLVTENPRQVFAMVLNAFFKTSIAPGIESSAFIHPSSTVGTGCYIGRNVVVEENCTIGEHCVILHNTVILAGTVIGHHVHMGCNNTIGNYGFGYEKNTNGDNEVIPHLGNVVIKDHVEIHNNVCIDRALLGSTVIRENVKVDNLVHIAHGVKIGRNSLVIANAMIGGSAVIGENTWVAPSSSIKNQVKVGSEVVVGMNAVVLKDIADHETVVGNPAQSLEDYKAWSEKKKLIMRES